MIAQIIICDQIQNDKQSKIHTLGTILNHVHIPVLPFVVKLYVLVKISDFPSRESLDMQLRIYDEQDEIIGTTSRLVLRNYRDLDMIPGVDAQLELSLVIVQSGNIRIKCFIDEEEVTWYPLMIRLAEAS
ncbi:hypothetical protein GMA19_00169 [Paenibacillus polymyxa E681]|uniref:DUF6941 family protein n=1 Tax=Paenibacillus polymyxa TaxID=1406 RepID=UPI0001E315BD|nr:hypothetical protein [Paenibacillus polymyxa]ADM68054.1 hypothetical protein PPE_00169 [Paenibacillus polymyxa E681]QNV55049.1 hypothetical protein GE561_00169 [Paenibacillus polymyxa E681]QNV59886.1 hypothetical protein GMA19_00169 [Paenibacillus polymyxa E681]